MAKQILIADSDKDDQEEFQKIFETTGYHLIFSESGEDALLRIKLYKPDMIIASTTGLQEIGGVELCGVLKEDPEFKGIPFVLISSIFNEISEKDRKRVRADGMISRPLHEDEILNFVDHLMEEEAIGKRDQKEDALLLDGMEEEEEIIELMEVVEEPEPKMSIDNFITTQKEEPFGEITPLESWEKLDLDEKPSEREWVLPPEKEGEVARETDLPLKGEIASPKAAPEDELFEKIELEEILEKVEQLKPVLEKEWTSEKEGTVLEERLWKTEEPKENILNLEEFEASLHQQVKAEFPEEELQPFSIEEPGKEISEKVIPIEESLEEEALEELPEEEFPDELLEEILGEEEIGIAEESKEMKAEGVKLIEELEAFETPAVFEEEIKPLAGEVGRPMEEWTPFVKGVDQHLEEVVAKGVQDMVGDFITKILPEMTQHIMGLTAERIEKMVKEIVPDLAEKVIQEEIRRLRKEEKEQGG